MKHIRLVSDIHLDADIRAFSKTRILQPEDNLEALKLEGEMSMLWYPPPMEGDKDTTFVIAGDLWYDRKFLKRKYTNGDSWMKRVSRQFKYVVFVLGNHDYWECNLSTEVESIKVAIANQGITNVFLLEKGVVVLDNVKFLGGTLWTNYANENPLAMIMAPQVMVSDHKLIRIGPTYRKARVEDFLSRFKQTIEFIFQYATKDNEDQKVVCVTHMAPSYKSIHEMYKTAQTNAFYYSDLELELFYEEHDISLWFHGHTHSPMDYTIHDKTRVVCNPRGYRDYEQTNYNDCLRFDV